MSDDRTNGPERLEPCDLCAGADLRLVAVESNHRIWKCRTCGLCQVRPLPAQTRNENRSYWQVGMDDPAVRRERLGSQSVFGHGLDRLEQATGSSVRGKRVLDVGCGMGAFLELAKGRGAIPYGIDLSPEAAEFTRRTCGIDTASAGEFEQLDYPDGFFHVVTGWNVLEHVHSPRRWLEQAHRLLADDGVLLVKVPNVNFSAVASKLAPALRKLRLPMTGYLASRPPLHLYGFTPATLRRMLVAGGFDVLSVERAPIRESRGLKGKIIVAMAQLMSCMAGSTMAYHPVIMALARKRNPAGGR